MSILTVLLDITQAINLKDALDFIQTFGLSTVAGFLFRQFLSFRDTKRDVADLQLSLQALKDDVKSNDKKIESREIAREEKINRILSDVQELKFEFKNYKTAFTKVQE